MKRKEFLKALSVGTAAAALGPAMLPQEAAAGPGQGGGAGSGGPIALSTWNFNLPVNQTAMKTLGEGGSLLDAVERGINVVEADPKVTSVGRGGFPDRDGHVTLDACIMDEFGNAGSVVFLEDIVHPVSVARKVMEKTPHVILAGEGALQFAVENGFQREHLLTDEAKKAYEEWLKKSAYQPHVDEKNHDTVGLLVLDARGMMAGGCSTSGAAWKVHGRVGDSPIIGAGLYVDSEVGGAASTGLGELAIKVCGSFLVVELMRRGASPQDACVEVVERIIRKYPASKEMGGFLIGFIALSKRGEVGAYSYGKGLQYSLMAGGVNTVHDASFMAK